MGITLDDAAQTGTSTPSVQFHNEGDSVVFGVVNVEEIQSFSRDRDGNKELHFWNNDPTQPKMMKIVTGLVVTGTAAKKDGDTEAPVAAGDIVSLYASGQRWTAWQKMLETHGAIEVGDVVQWKLDELAPNKTPGWSAVKVCSINARKPKADDGDLVDRCVAAYHGAKERPSVDASPAPAPATAPAPAIEEPF